MPRFTVVWATLALAQLATIWTESKDRAAVSAATNEIDRQLAQDPHHKGKALSEGLRKFAIRPLGVVFSIDEANRIVEVGSVKRVPPLSSA